MSDFIPQEIVKEILYRLSAHSLIKCTVVCKHWRSLITSPSFISTYHHHRSATSPCPPPLFLRYFTEPPKTQLFSLIFNPKDPIFTPKTVPFKAKYNFFFRIVGVLNGVVCLSDDYFSTTHVIILWNPSIKRFILLPKPVEFVGLYVFVLGFGFDSKRCDYKVVRLAYAQSDGEGPQLDVLPPKVSVFSLNDCKWKNINAGGVKYCVCGSEWSVCFMYGCVHWIAFEYKLGGIESLILMFDVSEERFKIMRLPCCLVKECPYNSYIAEIGGNLAVLKFFLELENGEHRGCCDVWVRKEYRVASSWVRMWRVDVEGGVGSILNLRPSGEFLVATVLGKLVSYNPENHVTKNLGIQGVAEAFYVADYTESLVLLDQKNAASYGGAKKKSKEKRIENVSGSIGSEYLEQDTSSILISEETDGDTSTNQYLARFAVHGHKVLQAAYQFRKFKGIFSVGMN